jgi:hypothetical protein
MNETERQRLMGQLREVWRKERERHGSLMQTDRKLAVLLLLIGIAMMGFLCFT